MTHHEPTIIFANEEQKRLWLGALRGEIPNPKTGKPFEQGKHKLETEKGSHCCLGVLQTVLKGDVSRRDDGTSQGLPSRLWLDDAGICFIYPGPSEEMPDRDPWLPLLGKYASTANDDGASFTQIADAIEACSIVRSASE